MPMDSCVAHREKYFIRLHRDYIQLMNGDHCAAILLDMFEYLTTGEIERREKAGEDPEPWLCIDASKLSEELINHYCSKTINKALDSVISTGLVSRKDSYDNRSLYLFNYKATEEALKKNKRFTGESFVSDSKELIQKNFGKISELIPSSEPVYKEEEQRTENREQSLSLSSSFEDLKQKQQYVQETSPAPADQHFARRTWERLGKTTLRGNERQQFIETFSNTVMTEEQVEISMEIFWDFAKTHPEIKSHVFCYLGKSRDPQRWLENRYTPSPKSSSTIRPIQSKTIKTEQHNAPPIDSITNLEQELAQHNPLQFSQYQKYWTKMEERHLSCNTRLDPDPSAQAYILNLLLLGKVWMYDIDCKHRTYCWSKDWQWEGGVKVPQLYQWLAKEKYKRCESSVGMPGQFWVEYEKDIAAVKAYQNSKLELAGALK